ncbi:hypothetical protein AB0K60_17090 [Thermopolyspora sp. NPDC052614]|uniref:hypothetical protein n=1 Tax=Thermopolyspora sp. NPDC052614 TaxID=3155682 RepID=UPI00341BD74F
MKYRTDRFAEEDLAGAVDSLIEIIAKHYSENPDYVSLEIVPQNAVTRNRKDVDLELDSAPDSEGHRARVAPRIAADLAAAVIEHLERRGHHDFEVSAWIRIFADAPYHYQRT